MRRQGERSSPEMEKCRNLMLFPTALFLVTTYPKLFKIQIFLLNFHRKISRFSQDFPTTCIFNTNARNINAAFLKFFEKYAKIIHFCNFLKKSFANFETFPVSPPAPTRPTPLNSPPRT